MEPYAAVYAAAEDEVLEAKQGIIRREGIIVSSIIPNIGKIRQQSKVQLQWMANDFLFDVNHALHVLNHAVPSINNTETYDQVGFHCTEIVEGTNEIHTAMHENFKELQEGLEYTVNRLAHDVTSIEKRYKVPNEFMGIQLKRKNDHLIFGIHKLKFQTLFFEMQGDDLEYEVKKGIAEVTVLINTILTTDGTTRRELHRLLVHLSVITKTAVLKLQNWIEINRADKKNMKLVKNSSNGLAKLYGKQMGKVCQTLGIADLKIDLTKMLKKFGKYVLQLGKVKYSISSRGDLFIRSVLFDSIAFTKGHTENLTRVLVY